MCLSKTTLLHKAARSGGRRVAKLLLAIGADPNAKDHAGNTPLYEAVRAGQKEVAELLRAKGADVNALNSSGTTMLHEAARAGQKGTAELLLGVGANANAKDHAGNTPLYEAVRAVGQWEVALLLRAKGADVNALNSSGTTMLHEAARAGKKGTAELLLAIGADVNVKGAATDRPFDWDVRGGTPLHLAAEQGHKDIVELLLAKRADVNAKSSEGNTPLWVAVDRGREDMVELLLAKGADVRAKNNGGSAPLHRARSARLAELLLAKGADVNAEDGNVQDEEPEFGGRTALDLAVSAGQKEVVGVLLSHGGILRRDPTGRLLLHHAEFEYREILAYHKPGAAGEEACQRARETLDVVRAHLGRADLSRERRKVAAVALAALKREIESAPPEQQAEILGHISNGALTSICLFGMREDLFRVFLRDRSAYAGYAKGQPGLFMVAGFHDGGYRDFILVEVRDQRGEAQFQKLASLGAVDEIKRSVLTQEEIILMGGGVASVSNYASPGTVLTSMDEFNRYVSGIRSQRYVTMTLAESEQRKREGLQRHADVNCHEV